MLVKIDLLIDPFQTTWSDFLETARAAESLGFDGVWTWDHLAGEVHGADRVLEGWTALTAVAASTQRVTIGPLVLNVGNRRPGVLAVMAATLQEVSNGRLLLGVGAGGGAETPYHREQLALGADVPGDGHRRQHVLDTIAVCREVWTGTTTPRTLPTERLGAGRGFLQPVPPPPVIVGGFGPSNGRAGRIRRRRLQHPSWPPPVGRAWWRSPAQLTRVARPTSRSVASPASTHGGSTPPRIAWIGSS